MLAGRYRLGDVLGSGGMGRVWRARDEVLHRTVAIKELRAGLYAAEADRAVLHARTQKEARAAARINHPGVVTVHDVLDHDDRPWIVMEYVDGPSLADALKETGSVSPEEGARIGLQVLGALRAAHQVGVLHRDVKPGNVMLAKDGRVLLTDFGIAAIEGDSTITRTGELVGSLDYLAPERIRGEEPGPASDLWALGATLYTAVEERSPFRRTSPISTMQAVVAEEPSPSYNAGALAPVISALLRKEPDERPTAAETERMLREARAGRSSREAQAYVSTRHVPEDELRSAVPVPPTTALPGPPPGPGPGTGNASAFGQQSGQTYGGQQSGQSYGGRQTGQSYGGQQHGQPHAGQQHGQPHAAQQYPQAYQHPSTGHTPFPPHTTPQSQVQVPQQQDKRRGKALLVVLAAALISGGAVFGVLQWQERNFTGSGGGTTASGQQGGGDPAKDKGGDKGEDPADGKDKPKKGALPAGWEEVDEKGFSLPVPKGWKRVGSTPNAFDYTPDGGIHLIRINVDRTPDYRDPNDHLAQIEKTLRKTLPAYQRERMGPDNYRDRPSGVLEFTFREKGLAAGPRYAKDMLYIDDSGPEYAIYVIGPESEREKTKKRFDTVKAGWKVKQ
ncbi:protein kinase [Streptomyces sp. NBC_00237]|uniref:serine/threonine-protein kinase n=1 Tax=Streptomyces sp. NBC_00237 TaxID=2975687 RepID=UPI00225A9B18|nr:serine/threonine-protein kinase [Streptomyces sp. NBC_00237]MCX5204755.1 protein kinase [Streptomyces sp. NBC_00237]